MESLRARDALRERVATKSASIARIRGQFAACWLVLVDEIGLGILDETDARHFGEMLPDATSWEKVVIVSGPGSFPNFVSLLWSTDGTAGALPPRGS